MTTSFSLDSTCSCEQKASDYASLNWWSHSNYETMLAAREWNTLFIEVGLTKYVDKHTL